MTKLIKKDKRDKTEGYCLLAGEGWLNIIQGGNGDFSGVIRLKGKELEQFIADLDDTVNQMAIQHLKKAS